MTTTLTFRGLQQQSSVGVNANKKQEQLEPVGEGLQQALRVNGSGSGSGSTRESGPESAGVVATETERSLNQVNIQEDGTNELRVITASLEELAERVVDGFSGVDNAVTNQEFLTLRDEYQRVRQAITSSSGESLLGTAEDSLSINIGGINGQISQVSLSTGFPSAELETNFDGLDYILSGEITSVATSGSNFQAGDFNNDGVDDIVVVDTGDASIFLSNGDGTFSNSQSFSPVSIEAAPSARGFALEDFDNDGNLDIAVLIRSTGSIGEDVTEIRIYDGNGDGTFSAGSFGLLASGQAQGIASGDFDGDGDNDLVVSTDIGTHTRINNGDGSISGLDTGGSSFATLSVGDFDQDGVDEVITTLRYLREPDDLSSGQNLEIYGRGIDINGDGALDFVGSESGGSLPDTQFFRLGNGDGTFGAVTTLTDTDGAAIEAGYVLLSDDLDGDGDQDFITVNNDVFLNDGTGSFFLAEDPIGTSFTRKIIGDFDNDGVTDFIVSDPDAGSTLNVYLGSASADTLRVNNSEAAAFADTTLESFEVGLEGIDRAIEVVQDSLSTTLNTLETKGIISDPEIDQTIRTEREAEAGVSVLLDAIFRDSTLAIDSIGSLNPATVQNLLGTDREEDEEDGPLLF